MPATYTTTARNALRKITGTSKVSDLDEGIGALADDVDTKMASFVLDTLAKRPAAGQPNRFFLATDTGWLFRDTGSIWAAVSGSPGAYSAKAAIATTVEVEMHAERPAVVVFSCTPNPGETVNLYVGAVNVATIGGANNYFSATFEVPPGTKWHFVGNVASASYSRALK